MPIGDRRHGGLRLAAEPEPIEGALRLGVWIVVVEHEDEDAPRDLVRVRVRVRVGVGVRVKVRVRVRVPRVTVPTARRSPAGLKQTEVIS